MGHRKTTEDEMDPNLDDADIVSTHQRQYKQYLKDSGMDNETDHFNQYRQQSSLHPNMSYNTSSGALSVGGMSYQQQQQLAYQQRMAAMQYQQHSYHAAAMGSYNSNYSGASTNNLVSYSSAIHAMNQNSTRSLGQPGHIITHSQSSIALPHVSEDKAIYDPTNPNIPPPPSQKHSSPQMTKLSDPDQRSPSIDYGEFSISTPAPKSSKCCVIL